MTVQEIMERVGSKDTTLIIAWLKDAMNIIQSNYEDNVTTWTKDITDGTRDYVVPANLINLTNVSVLDTEIDKYVKIRRIISKPTMRKDNSPE